MRRSLAALAFAVLMAGPALARPAQAEEASFGERVGTTADRAASGVGRAARATGGAVKRAARWTGNRLGRAGEWTRERAERVGR